MLFLRRFFFPSIYSCYIIIDNLQEPILTEKKIIIYTSFTLQYSGWGYKFNSATAGRIIDLKRVGVTNAFKTSLGF